MAAVITKLSSGAARIPRRTDWYVTQTRKEYLITELFHGGALYHIENGPSICYANQWTGFYTIGTSVMKELTNWVNGQVFLYELRDHTSSIME